ncbi:Osmotic growth protein [Rhodotorula kratochvilovae]
MSHKHDAAQLLSWIQELYDWLVPCVPSGRNSHHDRRDLGVMKERMGVLWPLFLPSERTEAVDRVLAVYCDCKAGEPFKPSEVKYNAMVAELGYIERERPLSPAGMQANMTLQQQRWRVDQHFHGGGLVEHSPLVQATRRWATLLTDSSGVGLDKLKRLDDETIAALEVKVEALPTADALLAEAQLETQSPEDRFQIFALLLGDLVKLYASRQSNNYLIMSHVQEEVRLIRGAAKAVEGKRAVDHFESLAVEQQERVMVNARAEVIAIDRIVGPLLNPHLHVGSAEHPLVVESLAHAHAGRGISDRKARLYYGTSARAWAGKALLLYAGKEASEEFNMLHDAKVVAKYAPDTIVGTYKQE